MLHYSQIKIFLQKNVISRIRGSSFLRKNFVTFILIFTLFAFFVIFAFRYFTKQQALKNETERYLRISERAASQMHDLLNEMSRLSIYISSAPFANKIEERSFSERNALKDMYAFLLPFGVPTGKAQLRISLMNDQNYFFSVGYPTSAAKIDGGLKSDAYKSFYADTISQDLTFLPPHRDFWNNDNLYYPFTCVRRIRDVSTFKIIGLISVEEHAEKLQRILSQTADEEMFLLDSSGHTLTMSAVDTSRDFSTVISAIPANDAEVKKWYGTVDGSDKALYFLRKLEISDWSLLVKIDEKKLLAPVSASVLAMLILLVALYMFFVPTAYVLMRYTAKPLKLLREQIERVNADHLGIAIASPLQVDEVTLLNDALLSMMSRLKDAADEGAAMRARELHASFLALQAQINPHFLFNIITVLSDQARNKQTKVLETALVRLSHMLRYMTQSMPRTVKLSEELSHLEDYLALMKLRFEEHLIYEIYSNVDENKNCIIVPRMSLQPIIENAFSHGFSQVLPPFRIKISIKTDAKSWFISIYNNGAGLNAEEISKLEKKIDSFMDEPGKSLDDLKIGGMGLVSCLSRFGHLYGKDFDYEIISIDESDFTLILKGALNFAGTDCR